MADRLSTRRRLAAVAAGGAVVFRVASIFLWPPGSDASHARMLATAADHPAAWQLATGAEVLAWLLAGFAVLTAIRLVAERGFWLTQIGGWMYGVSLLALGFVGGAMNSVTGVLAAEPSRVLMVRVQGDLSSPVLTAMVSLVLLGELFTIVLGLGLARSRLVGWWYPVLSAVAVAAYVLTSDSSSHLVNLAGFVPLAASWLVLASLLASRGSRSAASVAAAALTATPA
jgi:hypothetical protein